MNGKTCKKLRTFAKANNFKYEVCKRISAQSDVFTKEIYLREINRVGEHIQKATP